MNAFGVFSNKLNHETWAYVMTIARNGIKMKVRTEGDGGDKPTMLIRGAKILGRDTTVQFLATGLQKLVLNRTARVNVSETPRSIIY